MALFSSYLMLSVISLESVGSFQAKQCFQDLSLAFMHGDQTVVTLGVRNQVDTNKEGILTLDVLPNVLHDLIVGGLVQKVNVLYHSQVICSERLEIPVSFRLQQDSIIYLNDIPNCKLRKPRKMAAFTHVYNPGRFLEIWSSYYAKIVGRENLYVLDHESTDGSVQRDSNLYHRVPVPRGELDHVNMAKFCGHFQRFLLSNYEWIIHTDCDEFLVTQDGPESFSKILDQYPQGATLVPEQAIELIESPEGDLPMDWREPLCSQRKWSVQNHAFLKPALSSRPTTWTPGFHQCFDEVTSCPSLWMVHAKWASLETHIHMNAAFCTQKQSALDETFFWTKNSNDYQTHEDSAKAAMAKKFKDAILSNALCETPEWLNGQF